MQAFYQWKTDQLFDKQLFFKPHVNAPQQCKLVRELKKKKLKVLVTSAIHLIG
jgi:hypothetical protein